MSLDTIATESPVINGLDDLLQYFRGGERLRGPLLLGIEHEKLIFPTEALDPVPYEGPRGIGRLLERFGSLGWAEYREAPGLPTIAMTQGPATVSLEPGGQVEFSGTPMLTARAAHDENLRHLRELKALGAELGLRAVTLGYRPFHTLEQMPWMPKTRYRLMRTTLGARGTHAHHMMLMTATGQVSLDWRDEADCARKVLAAARVAPIVVALFANSPVVEGRPSGLLSFRSRVWNDVDPSRAGYPRCMLDGSFSYRGYVEWALDAPMLFLRREGRYLDVQMTFRQFLAKGHDGSLATHSDWVDHASTLFPEVRIKKVLEIRSADGNDAAMTAALAALMRAVLYDDTALGEVMRLVPPTSPEAHLALHRAAQRVGLAAEVGRGTLRDAALDLLAIARRALERLDPLDAPLLDPLDEIARTGVTRAQRVLEVLASSSRPDELLRPFEI